MPNSDKLLIINKVKLGKVNLVLNNIKRWALKKALNNIGPSRRTIGGPGSELNNDYSVHILRGVNKRDIVREFEDSIIKFETYDKNAENAVGKGSININELNLLNVEISYYYKNYIAKYKNINSFILCNLTKYDVAKAELDLFFYRVKQFYFNKKKLEMKPRYDLLEMLIKQFGYHQETFHEMDVSQRMFSIKVFAHPQREFLRNQIKLYLESFVESGEIKETSNGEYRVTGKALLTLEKFQLEERRFKKMAHLQKVIAFLTIVMALASAIQAKLITF